MAALFLDIPILERYLDCGTTAVFLAEPGFCYLLVLMIIFLSLSSNLFSFLPDGDFRVYWDLIEVTYFYTLNANLAESNLPNQLGRLWALLRDKRLLKPYGSYIFWILFRSDSELDLGMFVL